MPADLISTARRLRGEVDALRFGPPVTHVYNPLDYAWGPSVQYMERFGAAVKEVVLLGMNPGPWGMAQTGVPFGEVTVVREWLKIDAPVRRPENEHPKRPVLGLECPRHEVSGERLWGWARDAFVTPEAFFERFFIWNYCPLSFMEQSGRNRTPDKLPAEERRPLFEACDRSLKEAMATLRPSLVVGIGRFAEDRARSALRGVDVRIGRILHPSPASPAANRGWREQATAELRELGVRLPNG